MIKTAKSGKIFLGATTKKPKGAHGEMFIGIDVGGTFTDGILLHEGKILSTAKHPTDANNLQSSIISVLDRLIRDREARHINRVVLSTTLVTNLIATGKGDQTALVLIPGPGLNVRKMRFFPHTFIIDGATDFRGRIIKPLNEEQVKEAGEAIAAAGIKKVAVVGKFSPRNSSQEQRVQEILLRHHPQLEVITGFQVSGQLNFLRRAVTTYYTAMTKEKWSLFAEKMKDALEQRGINCPVSILKADGGTMPLSVSLQHPCETVFSGPAASAMGAFALTLDEQTSVVVDIGGTTTDLALILQGRPLYASKGARIQEHYTSIRSFAVRSIPIGGDSAVSWNGSRIMIGPHRSGPAACFGGPAATPTDAVNFLAGGNLGELELSRQALAQIAQKAGLPVRELAQFIVEQMVDSLEENIRDMFKSWEQEPAYKIYEIVHKRRVKLDRAVGIGAAAGAFVPLLAERMQCQSFVHSLSPVANALGAAVSRPTLSLLLHADTQQKSYYLNLEGISGQVSRNFQLADAKELAKKHLQELARKRGMEAYASQHEFFLEEQFNMIRGWSTMGKLFDVGIQIVPGVINEFEGVHDR
jgi:N-methylhydantoinase A